MKRTLPLFMAFLSLGLGVWVYVQFVYQLGFPDGFISELARAQRRLAYVFITLSLMESLLCFYQAMVTPKSLKILKVTGGFYLLLMLALLLLNAYYRTNLPGSSGG